MTRSTRRIFELTLCLLTASIAPAVASAESLSAHPSLKGYQQALTEYEVNEGQGTGTATCPSGTVLVGGGVTDEQFPALTVSINSSRPSMTGATWNGTFNNPVDAGTDYILWAECVTKVADYSIVAGPAVDNPTGSQTPATASCPSGTVALGGGGRLSSGSTSIALNDDYPLPTGKGWSVDANNLSGGDDTVRAYVICGKKPAQYVVMAGPGTAVGASSRADDNAVCPSGLTVLGGGGKSSSRATTVDLNSTGPAGNNSWDVNANDTGSDQSVITAYAVCTKLKS